ncbi:hypothetical protein PTSG_10400 [Salpingoeca rosetta]|uniref:Choline/carnitine acyltransferase domain-containing protein n=1 Tax=Salpingoeca rosetta (strain ATCC 50818 / BSB-021) TaxID=946362 RepID=F2UR71_SALR5|nr:uncharacterized protein PTSG_10400 [Salpingoeca rosetta]EGD80126.1 hypothetical protein PTSG_10400 [Salpingoeca rosetta]|eukprot:XP_004988451.1 hypothetical protein PTSG_10400 [Salpingoeca rosetta]
MRVVLQAAVLKTARRALTSDGYLHKTVIPTFKFQDSLPKLKIPKLEDSLQKYVASATPLVSPDELQQTKAVVDDFANTEGKILQDHIVAEDKKHYSSYISAPWFDMYLRFRDPLPINMNPQLTMKDDPDPAKHKQAPRAASLISASVAFYRTLRDRQLSPDVYHTKPHRSETPFFQQLVKMAPNAAAWYIGFGFGAFALDMSQYANLFSSTRVPQPTKDQLVVFDERQSRHIIIQYGHDFFKLNVLHQDGTAVPEAEIRAALEDITSKPASTAAPPLGAATTMNRDKWATLRNKVMGASPRNLQHMSDIDSALFAVCLEDSAPGCAPMTPLGGATGDEYVELSEAMLYGNGRNRWFDKSFQLIVTENGKSAVNFEHSWGDGVAVLRYFQEVYKESIATPTPDPRPKEQAVKLDFDFTDELSAELKTAAEEFDAFKNTIDMKVLQTQVRSASHMRWM